MSKKKAVKKTASSRASASIKKVNKPKSVAVKESKHTVKSMFALLDAYIKQNKSIPDKSQFLSTQKINEWELRKLFGGWQTFLNSAAKENIITPELKSNTDLVVENTKLKIETSTQRKIIEDLKKEVLTTDSIKNLIYDFKEQIDSSEPRDIPWLIEKPKQSSHGIPVLFISDVHFDEVVEAAQVQFTNSFNREIAIKRLQHTFNTTSYLLKENLVNPKYEGIVLALGGDIFSGNIHEELAETNEGSVFESMLVILDVLIQGIEKLKKDFGKVFIPAVTGNHGRLHKKMRFKNRVFDNYEWCLYQFLNRHFSQDPDVSFMIPEGPDAQFQVYDKSILLTHGDQFRGGAGISGIFTPLMLGMHRKQKRNNAVKRNFDIMMVGHFHQLIMTPSLVVNGSVKGMDEFAFGMNFPFEPPQQALFVVHPNKGITMQMPILCHGYEDTAKYVGGKISAIF